MVKVLCIVQARLTSTRLPNKVMMELGKTGISLLEHTYMRLCTTPSIDRVVFAIPDTPSNDKLASYLQTEEIPFFRGSEDNVLKRFYECAIHYQPEIIVRATCDNPCVDYIEAERVINALDTCDYAASLNAPLGTAIEAFRANALYKAYNEAHSEVEKEHVTPYLYKNEKLFRVVRLPYSYQPRFKMRLTVDTEQDLELINAIYQKLYKGKVFSNQEIYNFLESNPDLLSLNAEIQQKTI